MTQMILTGTLVASCCMWYVVSQWSIQGRTGCWFEYRRLWLFSAPRQLGAYYYISTHVITVTRPGLLSACALNRMLRLEHVREKWPSEHETKCCHCYGPNNIRRLCCPREPNKKGLGTCPTTVTSGLSKATAYWSWGFPASCRTCTISPVLGVHIPLKIWWPRITLSWRKIACHLRSCCLFHVPDRYVIDRSHVRLSHASSCWAWLQ